MDKLAIFSLCLNCVICIAAGEWFGAAGWFVAAIFKIELYITDKYNTP